MARPQTEEQVVRNGIGVPQNPEKRAEDRPDDRIPFGAVPPLEVDGLEHEKFKYHWFNDENDELYRAQRAGYRFVPRDNLSTPADRQINSTGDLGNMMCRGTRLGGAEIKTYLMACLWADYNRNQAKELAQIQSLEDMTKSNRQKDLDEAYTPDDKRSLFDKALARDAMAR